MAPRTPAVPVEARDLRASAAFGRASERRSSPYPERAETEASGVDRLLLSASEGAAARLPLRRRALGRLADRVIAAGPALAGLGEADLAAAAWRLRPALLRHGFRSDLVVEAFALAREASGRRLGKRHHRTQLMGGGAILQGWLAEMATGEGKTLTAALPACVAALAGLPVHVVTVNDYLAGRDADLIRPLYEALGLSVAAVVHDQSPAERRAVYAADIVYTANNEVVFDYLKDRLALGPDTRRAAHGLKGARGGGEGGLLLRGLGFAVIDEADSVLIDEARTPLIISAENDADEGARYRIALDIAGDLDPAAYRISAGDRSARLTPSGREGVGARAPIGTADGIWGIAGAREELIEQALCALHLFRPDEQYMIVEGTIQIIDEFTGRIAEGRTWEQGLHQLIEVKEGLALTRQRATLAKLTYQRFFRRYLRAGGMSGTAFELAGEFRAVYALPVVRIPTHRPSLRITHPARLLPDGAAKWRAVAEAAAAMAGAGRPVLVGTRSVAASETLAAVLTGSGLAHQVLNARHDKAEAEIVAKAGEAGRITVATNMAGRGTDIHLGPGVAEAGGLHVILTEFHESARIDRQLVGRGARQGDPGSWQAIVARDDDLFLRFAPAQLRAVAGVAVLRRWCQAAAERANAAARRAAQAAESQERDRLAFAGEAV